MKQMTIIIFMLMAFTFAYQWPCGATTNTTQLSVQELGFKDGKPVTNGFVFIDGKYLELPYTVTRQGNGIFINGYLIEKPCPWPIPEKTKPQIPTEEPKMPKSIAVNTSKYDKELQKYIGMKKAFYFNKYQKEEALSLMAQAYAELPCVTSAKLSADPEILDVTWSNGEISHIRLVLHLRKPTEWTRESILDHLEKTKANYEDRLNKGDYYFLGTDYGRMTGTATGAKMILPVLLPALKTSKDAKEVHQRLQQAGIVFMDDKACEAFFANCSVSKQLEERVKALTNNGRGVSSQSSTNGLTGTNR